MKSRENAMVLIPQKSSATENPFESHFIQGILNRMDSDFKEKSGLEKSALVLKLMYDTTVHNKLVTLNNTLTEQIVKLSANLNRTVEKTMFVYFQLAHIQKDNLNTVKNSEDLNEDELTLLAMIESFDIQNLNPFKNLSKDEEEVLQFCTDYHSPYSLTF